MIRSQVSRLASSIVALALPLLLAPRAGEAQGQCWQFDVCTLTAPFVGILGPTQVTQSSVALTIYMSDPERLNLGTAKLWRNGVDVTSWYSTASSPGDPNSQYSKEYVGSLSLSLGANTIIAEVCDLDATATCGRDTVVVTYAPPPPPPPTAAPVLTLAQRADARDLDAGAATYDYSTVPYFSMDSPRGVTLHYSSGAARPSAEIQVSAVIRSSQVPTAISIQVKDSSSAVVYPERFFAGDTGTFHLAARFASACGGAPLCAKRFRVFVRAYYGSASTFTIDSLPAVRVLIEDASNSRAGAGWTIAGVERLVSDSVGIVLSDGLGQLMYFSKTGCTGSGATEACDYSSPIGDFRTLKRTPAHPDDGSRYFLASKSGDTTYFSNTGQVVRARNRFGSGQVRFGWAIPDSLGARLDSIIDPAGRTVRLLYEPLNSSSYRGGSLTLMSLPDGRTVDVRVSSALGDLTQVLGPDNVTDFTGTYDGSTHRLVAHAERIGGGSVAYDQHEKVSKLMGVAVPLESGGTGADSVIVSAVLSRALAGSGATYGSGSTPPLKSDSAYSRSLASNGEETKVWTHHLGGVARLRVRAANGDTTVARNGYNTLGQLASSEVVGQAPTLFTYEGIYGQLQSSINTGTGEVTTYAYGPYGQVSHVYINGVLQSQAFFSGASLAPESVRSDTANTVHFKYDGFGRIVSVRDPRQAVDSTTYDPATGNVATQRSFGPGLVTRTASFAYDGSGRVSQVTDHLGRVATMTYDALNRTTGTVSLGADVSAWTYNDVSRTYTFTDPNGNVYGTQLNAAGWTTSETDPYGQSTTYGYDRRGNVVRLTDRRGIVTRWHKDALDRDTLLVAGTDTTRYAYDPNKRWLAVRNAESIDTLRVDAAGRQTSAVSVRGGQRYITTMGWIGALPDAVSFEGKNGSTTLWTRTMGSLYDAPRRTKVIVDFDGQWTHLAFDRDGAVKSVTLANNISTQTQTYSARRELTQMAFTGGAGGLGRTFHYDASSRIWQMLRGTPSDTYSRVHTYDSRDRMQAYRDTRTWVETVWQEGDPFGECPYCLTPVDITHVDTLRAASYSFDKLGNRTGAGIAYVGSGRHRLQAHSGESFTYDAEGNVLTRTGGALGTVAYTWNALGQLVAVAVAGGATTTYGYDGFGQRVRRTVGGDTTRYVLHAGQVALELSAAGAVRAAYTYYPGTDRPHGMQRGGVQYFYVQDAQGNVIGLVRADGTVAATYEYTPHGEPVGGSGTVENPYRYKGREWDAASGLYYMRARYYDPGLGRFVSEDPIGLAGGLNPYLFVEGDPVNYADPSGLAPDCELTIEFHVIDGRVRAAVYCANVPGGRLPPTYIHPQDFSRADASANFLSATGRGACGFCGGDGQAVFQLLGAAAQPTVDFANKTAAIAGHVALAYVPGVFATRASVIAWRTTGLGRVFPNVAVKRRFLKSLADDPNTPAWQRSWLRQGRNPPGYDVEHIVPLSVGGADALANMRLVLRADHRIHHKYHRPWEWFD